MLQRSASTEHLRVLIASESSLDARYVNGVSNSVKKVAEFLLSRGHDTRIITPRPVPEEYPVDVPIRGVRTMSLRQFPVGIPDNSVLKHEVAKYKPDIVHVASPLARLGHRPNHY